MTPTSAPESQGQLPLALHLVSMLPVTLLLVVVLGVTFTLPPGPLCDEGMILFMEGGCDWGESNIFFFSKLGLLISINAAFVIAWRRSVRQLQPFWPHFAAAAALAALTWSGGRCDTYYAHPNGSVGQMVIECAAFAALGLLLLRRWSGGALVWLAVALVAWNISHVAIFYLWLVAFDHWTWWHTVSVTLSLLIVGRALSFGPGAFGLSLRSHAGTS